jgi:cytochrome c oxidase subunit IV
MQQAHAEPNYMAVFYWLAGLTVLEVVVAFLPLTKFAMAAILIVLAFTKAALVALYFMHLKFERRTLMLVAITPVILCVGLMFSLVPDRVILHNRPAAPATQSTTTR